MVRLVAVAQALEDLHGVLEARLVDLHGLETTLERRVLLNVLAVLIQRGRANGLQLAARQLRLEQRRRVDRALGGTGADERVDLVDEQDDVAALVDLLEHFLQALLEVTAVARTRHQRAEVERVDLLVLQCLRDLAVGDVQRQALHDGRLTNAGLTDEHRVVLRTAREDLHDALDLLVAANHRVQLAFLGGRGEVAAELVQHQRVGALALLVAAARAGAGCDRAGARLRHLGVLVVALVAGEQLDDGLAHRRQVCPELGQDLRGDAIALADQAEQQELGADVLVAHLEALAQRQLEHLLRARRKRDVPGDGLRAVADNFDDLAAHVIEIDAHLLERLRGDALAFLNQAEQDVLRAHVIVVELARFFLRQHDHAPCSVRKPLEHGVPLLVVSFHLL